MDEPVHVIWRLVEKQYSLSNAAGVVGLVRQFNEMVNADFKSVGQLFQDLNSVRSQVNVNAHEALQTQMLSSQLMLVLVLGVLTRHMWGSSVEFTPDGFTLEKVSDMLNAIFGNNSRSEILALASEKAVNHVNAAPAKPSGSALGKRKGGDGPVRDIHHNLGVMKCHYCGGVHNSMKNIGPHKMVDCHKRAEDKAAGVHRCNIWPRLSRQARKEAYEPTPKMKGNVKGKAKAKVRREIPLAECMGKDVAVDACDAQHGNPPASDDGYMSRPPSNIELPLTPGRGITPFSDEDEPMESVVNAVNADAPGKAQAVDNRSDDDVDMEGHQGEDSKQTIAATTERFAGMMNELEKKVRTLYPFLLDDDLYLTSDSWVLDSGCGHGLTSETARFVQKEPNTQYMFTFAQGSKHSNTHLGTIELYLRGPQEIRPFLFENIVLVPDATSNILSEFWLRRGGYQIFGSLTGEYKFVCFANELVFIAKAINGAYYIQNRTLQERQLLCNAVKQEPCKPLAHLSTERFERTLQEWHVKLDHLSKDAVINMLSTKWVAGMPQLPASGLSKIPFFCTTCAEMKKRRMSYRNVAGSRDEHPISTIHMDTNGPMKTIGVYGSCGKIKYFLSIIDDNTSWRWT
ncbi:hypothetical protein PF007_g25767 [Phytophthora fragariae]|uniref:Retrovirus-related Pol polyprotein from transposon TNT 1-94-like beta-barrel domain-containing protein n=1 Tax=Phytophthora fragariae TaxID=53985 RepID=A0A6A3QD31_9STRA|nr:hypothetical protein PF003_g3635 [Phytophthora fragariae]KAE8923337.1 hypothetical protein PF009_g26410 [Phytophthora fragariae]KAE9073542.1 hypothetical protein PF007_g25767 [Phytophthora fragariae]